MMDDVAMRAEGGTTPALDMSAIEALYREQYEPMVRLAFVMVDDRSVAEELVQDVFARILRSDVAVRDSLPYLRSAIYNACRNHYRQRHRSGRNWARAVDADPPVADHVIDAVRALSPTRRSLIVLRYYSGLTDSEIASTTGLPIGTVKSNLHRALRELKGALS